MNRHKQNDKPSFLEEFIAAVTGPSTLEQYSKRPQHGTEHLGGLATSAILAVSLVGAAALIYNPDDGPHTYHHLTPAFILKQ